MCRHTEHRYGHCRPLRSGGDSSEGRLGRRSGLVYLPRLPSRDGLYEQLYDRHNPNWRPIWSRGFRHCLSSSIQQQHHVCDSQRQVHELGYRHGYPSRPLHRSARRAAKGRWSLWRHARKSRARAEDVPVRAFAVQRLPSGSRERARPRSCGGPLFLRLGVAFRSRPKAREEP
jgi:hypothetical protein